MNYRFILKTLSEGEREYLYIDGKVGDNADVFRRHLASVRYKLRVCSKGWVYQWQLSM